MYHFSCPQKFMQLFDSEVDERGRERKTTVLCQKRKVLGPTLGFERRADVAIKNGHLKSGSVNHYGASLIVRRFILNSINLLMTRSSDMLMRLQTS